MYDNIFSLPIGAQIRVLRQARGLSLQELARRAGTSAPALHRYEGGWDRFGIATLRRIAAALGAQLEVRLLPSGSRQPNAAIPREKQLLRLLSPLFWDKRLTAADLADHPRWVLGRVLMYGDLEQVSTARLFFGDDAVRDALAQRGIDGRTRNYWMIMFDDDHASQGTQR